MTLPEQLRRQAERLRARTRGDDDDEVPAAGSAAGPEPSRGAAAPVVAPTPPVNEINVHVEDKNSVYDQAVPDGLHVAAAWGWRVIVVAALVALVAYVLAYISEVTIPLLVAVLLTALLLPVTKRLHAWGVNRGLATAITVLGGLAVIAGVLYLIVSSIVSQASTLGTNVTTGFNRLADWLQNGPLHVSATYFNADEWVTRITDWVRTSQDTITTYAGEITSSVGHFVAGFALALFALSYFLHNGREIFAFVMRFFPRRSRARVDSAAQNGWHSLSSYVRATILVALADGVGVLIAALILGVPAAPALATLVFIGAFVPIVGGFVSGFVAVGVALVALGWVKALIMLGAIIAVVEIEGHVLQPFLMGRAVKLHPLAVLLAIAIGIILGGIIGALFAVPLLAFAKTFVQHLSDEVPDPSSNKVAR
ncbi:AI-2E family transporter [Microlunatus flavus]|uniref:Predicted PurR-regulated permease PerM n=1 Tax=Microlunatus flavus TaxID=1036181 RepID=A0A1H9K912_9ACTN|nr:AI-2E family transporter [Microlunatus flavus]SEQ95403.1 Predicted PurR-regulated permease PerM [Microlunatus flavus]